MDKRRVLILGGGHAGLAVARRLLSRLRPDDGLEVALVSEDTTVVWHGLMPQIVSNMIQPEDALVPVRNMVHGVTFYPYRVDTVDLAARTVCLVRGEERDELVVSYDYLVIALGSITDVSHFPGVAEHGLQARTIGDVFYLRNHIIDMLELASAEDDPAERQAMLTFVVAGAGFAGVEICAEMNGLLRDAGRYYPSLHESEIRVILLSYGSRILPPLSEGLAERALRHMRAAGVDVRLNTGLKSATAGAATCTSGERIPTRTLVAAVGIGPNPVVTRLPIQLSHGRIPCDAYGRVAGWPGVYAAGDAAAIPTGHGDEVFPPTLVCGHAEGVRVADNILAAVRGGRLRRTHSGGIQLAVLTKGYGLFQAGPVQLDGLVASLIWHAVFLAYIRTWYRRLSLFISWILSAIFPRDVTQVRINRTDAILPMRFGPGDVIVRQGEPGGRFYIIADGEVEVVRETPGGEQVLAHLGPGQYFGEVALLHDDRRMATVRAVTDVEVLALARGDFRSLVDHLEALRQSLEQVAAQRVAEDEAHAGPAAPDAASP